MTRTPVILALLASLSLVLAAALSQGGLAVFTDQESMTANTFTTKGCFPGGDTGFLDPSAQVNDTGGTEGDGFEHDPTYAFSNDPCRLFTNLLMIYSKPVDCSRSYCLFTSYSYVYFGN